MKDDYDSLLEVCKYQDTPAEILSFATQNIYRYQSYDVTTWEERQERLYEINKLEMLILNHPNCTKEVIMYLSEVQNDRVMPFLLMSKHNDSGSLMFFADRFKRESPPRLEWIALIANHEAATEGVIRELMTITDEEEINSMLQNRLNDLQGK